MSNIQLLNNNWQQFINQLSDNITYTENGHVCLAHLNDDLVELFFNLVRNNNPEEMMLKIMNQAKTDQNPILIQNLFILAFQTRWCRGGKGERKLFYDMLKVLYRHFPTIVTNCLDLIPLFGYWKDLFNLLEEFENINTLQYGNVLYEPLLNLCMKQHLNDMAELKKEKPELSFYAKYFPSQRNLKKIEKTDLKNKLNRRNKFFKDLAILLYPYPSNCSNKSKHFKYACMKLRKDHTMLRKALDIPEVKMCAQKWSEINFSRVCSQCMTKNNKAFLNENDNKHSEEQDRINCRDNLIKHIIDKGVHGAQTDLYQLVKKVFGNYNLSFGQKIIFNAQYESLKTDLLKKIQERVNENNETKTSFDLSKTVVMSDVSGSMSGDPMYVSIAFGILISDLAQGPFNNQVLTFDSNPVFHNLSSCENFVDKVNSLQSAPWGGFTNFEKAMNLICQKIKNNEISEENIPETLLVISDMQFNSACSYNSYYNSNKESGYPYKKICDAFSKLGQDKYGHPIKPPTIVFWNVRSSIGFPADSNEEGVIMMSGYSTSLLKFILSGEMEEVVEMVDEETGEVKQIKKQLTSEEMLQKVLQDSAFDCVRERVIKYDTELIDYLQS